MTFWVKCLRDGQTIYSEHEGMTQETIENHWIGLGATDIVFISQEDYQATLPPGTAP